MRGNPNLTHFGVAPTAGLTHRVAGVVDDTSPGRAVSHEAPRDSVHVSDIVQLRWDVSRAGHGLLTIDTPRTRGILGHATDRTNNLQGVSITPGVTRHDWCTIVLTMVEGESMGAAPGRALLVTTGETGNRGWKPRPYQGASRAATSGDRARRSSRPSTPR